MVDENKNLLEQQLQNEIDFEKLNELCEHLKDAIRDIFDSCSLYFRIFSRVKSRESIADKIVQGHYGSEDNPKKIQDLIGLRVVLYYYDDLSICRNIMEEAFQMVDSWSKTNYNVDEFKAAKINGVFKLPSEYLKLYTKEIWQLPIDTTFEIQFRTVFFEGWHEIEHDMRYKSLLSDDKFWQGSEELSRTLNCILANLELCDWSLVQLFEQLSYNHYKNANWELMLKSHFRIKMDDSERLDARIRQLFDEDKNVAKQFFKCSRKSLIRELLQNDSHHVTYNLIICLLNKHKVNNPQISEICSDLSLQSSYEPAHVKNTLAPLDTNTLFHLEVPLLHKDSRVIESEFNNACAIIFRWIRFRLNPVFQDMPSEVSSYRNTVPGYELNIDFQPDKLAFNMTVSYIDTRLPATFWHMETSVQRCSDDQLFFSHRTTQHTPHGAARQDTHSKPAFLPDLSSKTGLMDCVRLGTQAKFIDCEQALEEFLALYRNKERRLPVVLITQHTAPFSDPEYKNGYDMNTFPVNGMRVAKVIGLYAHVYMLDHTLVPLWAKNRPEPEDALYGCITISWPPHAQRQEECFTSQMICDTTFDFNRFASHGKNISEKAFRHKLVQLIKDYNVHS